MCALHLRQTFAEKIRRDVVVLPGNWPQESPTESPTQATSSANLRSAKADAEKRWGESPEAALEPLFRYHEALTIQPCWGNLTPLAYYAAVFFSAVGPDLEQHGLERWKSLIDAGLLDFCERVLSKDDLLSQIYQPWNLKFFEILESTFRTIHRYLLGLGSSTDPHHPLRIRAISIANQLWHIIIDRPHAFVSVGWDSSSKEQYQHMLCRVILAFQPITSTLGTSGQSFNGPKWQPYHRVVFFNWFHGHDPTDYMGLVESHLLTPYKHLFPLMFTSPLDTSLPGDEPQEFTSFVEDEIIGVYGAREFLDRLALSFQHPENVNKRLVWLTKMTKATILRQEFTPYIRASGLLWSMRQAADRQIMKGEKDDMATYTVFDHTLMVFSLFSEILSVSEGAAYLVKECDVIELLSMTVVLAVRIQPLVPLGYTGLSSCVHPLRVWTALGTTLYMRSGRNSLLKAFKHSVRREWYPTLVALRTLPKGHISNDEDSQNFARLWYELGMTVGLDENKEREEYERFGKRAARSCSWRECRYHTEPAPNPPRVCVGCGEVRYCGKPCQMKDWKQGQHKKRCKRLKEKPNVPRESAQTYGLLTY
ncbi:unnamed protein product [Peniophora sp. CBMAI 1063]|nr:unnamed protein product [Peniophora sp. CBMAI 1063]